MKITGDGEYLLQLRLRLVCEQYNSRAVQIQAVRDEIFDLINQGVITKSSPETIEKLVLEIVNTWGVQRPDRNAK
jgi:hypothetical protein